MGLSAGYWRSALRLLHLVSEAANAGFNTKLVVKVSLTRSMKLSPPAWW